MKKYLDKEDPDCFTEDHIKTNDYVIRGSDGNCWSKHIDDDLDKHYIRIVNYIRPIPYGLVNNNKGK